MRHGTDGELGERLTRARSERDELPAGEIDAPHGPAANDRRTVGTGSRLPAYPDRTGGRNLDLGQSVRAWHVERGARLGAAAKGRADGRRGNLTTDAAERSLCSTYPVPLLPTENTQPPGTRTGLSEPRSRSAALSWAHVAGAKRDWSANCGAPGGPHRPV